LNNVPENLQIVSNPEHISIHHTGKIVPIESRIKHSETMKQQYASGERDRDCSQMHTEDAQSKMAKSIKEKYASGVKMGWALYHERHPHPSEESKRKHSETIKRKIASGELKYPSCSDEKRRKISEALKRKYASGELIPCGHKHTLEDRIKMSEIKKQQIASGKLVVNYSAMHSKKSRLKALIARGVCDTKNDAAEPKSIQTT
jgi:hypothetical protein